MPLFIIHYSYRKQGGTCVGTRPPLLKSFRRLCILACKNAEKYARGYGAPPQTPPPSALRRFAPRSARDLRSLHRRVWSPKNSLCWLKPKLKDLHVDLIDSCKTITCAAGETFEPLTTSTTTITETIYGVQKTRLSNTQTHLQLCSLV